MSDIIDLQDIKRVLFHWMQVRKSLSVSSNSPWIHHLSVLPNIIYSEPELCKESEH